jgi:polar amino acid transport system substrate-binding protein
VGSRRLLLCLTAAGALASPACDAPRDPEGTLERATGGTIRVGVSANEPWVVLGSREPSGVEAELVRLFAEDLGAEIEWVDGTVDDLAAALHVREIDLLVAGLASTSGISSEAALTHPYVTTQVVVGVGAGESLDDVAGVEVAVERGTEAAGVLEKTDAAPLEVDDVAGADPPVAVDDYLLDDLGLYDSGLTLIETDHVMAVPHGENAWLVRLERFLLDHASTVERLLEEVEA